MHASPVQDGPENRDLGAAVCAGDGYNRIEEGRCRAAPAGAVVGGVPEGDGGSGFFVYGRQEIGDFASRG